MTASSTPSLNPFWDQRFAEPGYKYGTAPNAFLAAEARRLPATARVLVPGDGEGRNGVWLAGQGHRVQAVDSSAVGLAKARALAADAGVADRYATVLADLADLPAWQPAADSLDAVVLVYTHLPSALRRQVHRAAAAGLVPGGWLLLEAFHPKQLGYTSGGPRDADMLPTPADIAMDLDGLLTPLLAWDGETVLDEGPGHQGPAWVTRWIGRRAPPHDRHQDG